MISVDHAQDLCLQNCAPLDAQTIPLTDAAGRTMMTPAKAGRAQPPFAASVMDGYAVDNASVKPGARRGHDHAAR